MCVIYTVSVIGGSLLVSAPQFTDQRTREIYDLYSTGATLEEVGIEFSISRERVRQILREAGISTRSTTETANVRHARIVEERGEEICTEFSECQDAVEVSRRLDIPRAVVKEIVAERCPQVVRRRPRASSRKYSTEELVRFLHETSADVPGVMTAEDYRRFAADRRAEDGRPWPTVHTYIKRFGSWRKALARAGLSVAPRSTRSRRRFSDEECVKALRRAAEALERIPTMDAYSEFVAFHEGLPKAVTLTDRFGSWHEALTAAEL